MLPAQSEDPPASKTTSEPGRLRPVFRVLAWIIGPLMLITSVGGLIVSAVEYVRRGELKDGPDLPRALTMGVLLGLLFTWAAYTGRDPLASYSETPPAGEL